MHTRRNGKIGVGAFTLIELLVVLGIIGILAAIILPGVSGAKKAALKHAASGEVHTLELAFNAYVNEYKKVPRVFPTGVTPGPNVEGTVPYLEVRDNVLKTLLGENIQTNNPRKRIFLQLKANKIQNNAFVDPWGNPYRFMLDYDYGGSVMINSMGSAGELSTNLVGRSSAVWSRGPGPDNAGQYSEPIYSW